MRNFDMKNNSKARKWIKKHCTLSFILLIILFPFTIMIIGSINTNFVDPNNPSNWNDNQFNSGYSNKEITSKNSSNLPIQAINAGIQDANIVKNSEEWIGTVHVINYPHWDIEWGEPYHNMAARACSNIVLGISYCKLYSRFTMVLDNAWFVKVFWENYPEYRADFMKYVKQGRIEIVHGGISQPSEIVPSMESQVRDLLYGRNWFREIMGIETNIYWASDTLDGHYSGYGKMLAEAGYKYGFWSRDVKGQDNNTLTRWRFDNEKELIILPGRTYQHPFTLLIDDFVRDVKKEINSVANTEGKENIMMLMGTDFSLGVPYTSNFVDLWNLGPAKETGYRMVSSTPARFFSAVQNTLSISNLSIRDYDTNDVNYRDPGCFISKHMLKAENLAYEESLAKLEVYSTFAAINTATRSFSEKYNYDAALLESAWFVKSGAHHHDSVTGTNEKVAHDSLIARYQQGWEPITNGIDQAKKSFIGNTIGNPIIPSQIVNAIGGTATTTNCISNGSIKAIAVLNSNAWNRTAPVQFGWNWTNSKTAQNSLILFDSMGEIVPIQAINTIKEDSFSRYPDSSSGLSTGYLGLYPFDICGEESPSGFIPQNDYKNKIPNIKNEIFSPHYNKNDVSFVFIAKNIPSCGYKYYFAYENQTGVSQPTDPNWDIPILDINSKNIMNKFYNITLNTKGNVISIIKNTQKTGSKEYIDGNSPLNNLEYKQTVNSEYNFRAFNYAPLITSENVSEFETNFEYESGLVFSSIRVSQKMSNSTFNRTLRLYSGIDKIECNTIINYIPGSFDEKYKSLCVATNLSPKNALDKCVYGDTFSAKYREGYAQGEMPLNNWIQLETSPSLQSAAGNYSHQNMFLSSRIPIASYYNKDKFQLFLMKRSNEVMSENLTGFIGVSYDLIFGNGSFNVNQSDSLNKVQHAYGMRTPLDIYAPINCSIGSNSEYLIPLEHSYLAAQTNHAIITSINRATESNSMIIRAWNPFNINTTVEITATFLDQSGFWDKFSKAQGVSVIEQYDKSYDQDYSPQKNGIKMNFKVGKNSISTIESIFNTSIDLIGPKISSYELKSSSIFSNSWNTFSIEANDNNGSSNGVKSIYIIFNKDTGNKYSSLEPLRKVYSPMDFWIQPSQPELKEIVLSDKSHILTNTSGKWILTIPKEFSSPSNNPSTFQTEDQEEIDGVSIRYQIIMEDYAGNIVSFHNICYMPINKDLTSNSLIIGIILSVFVIGIIIIHRKRKLLKEKESINTEIIENKPTNFAKDQDLTGPQNQVEKIAPTNILPDEPIIELKEIQKNTNSKIKTVKIILEYSYLLSVLIVSTILGVIGYVLLIYGQYPENSLYMDYTFGIFGATYGKSLFVDMFLLRNIILAIFFLIFPLVKKENTKNFPKLYLMVILGHFLGAILTPVYGEILGGIVPNWPTFPWLSEESLLYNSFNLPKEIFWYSFLYYGTLLKGIGPVLIFFLAYAFGLMIRKIIKWFLKKMKKFNHVEEQHK
jgi:glycosyl hydrolase family 38